MNGTIKKEKGGQNMFGLMIKLDRLKT